jgi:hypothetical protein
MVGHSGAPVALATGQHVRAFWWDAGLTRASNRRGLLLFNNDMRASPRGCGQITISIPAWITPASIAERDAPGHVSLRRPYPRLHPGRCVAARTCAIVAPGSAGIDVGDEAFIGIGRRPGGAGGVDADTASNVVMSGLDPAKHPGMSGLGLTRPRSLPSAVSGTTSEE